MDDDDRISQLPECIVHHILSFLKNSPACLVRMSVLSKNWFAVTASFPVLNFNWLRFTKAVHASLNKPFDFFNDEDRNNFRDKFFDYVSYTTSGFCKQNISAHTFNLITEIKEPTEVDVVDRCVKLILNKGVQVLVIEINYYEYLTMEKYCLPNILLSVSSLTYLKISKCELPSRLMVDDVKFKSLKVLQLLTVHIDEEVIKRLTTSCPLLEEFHIENCYGFKRFCINEIQNLQKVSLDFYQEVERIDINAPNLSYLDLWDQDGSGVPSMNLALCKKLTTVSYHESPNFPIRRLKGAFADFSSNFPFIESLSLILHNNYNNLRLSSPSLRILVLHTECALEQIDINTPNLLLFNYNGDLQMRSPPSVRDSAQPKVHMECYLKNDVNTIWFQQLREFLEKKNCFKVLKLHVSNELVHVEELKLIYSRPYELDHVELELHTLKELSVCVAVVDAVLLCFRPRSLTLRLNFPCIDHKQQNKLMYEKLLQHTFMKLLEQEIQDQTNIQIMLSSPSKAEKHFSNLSSLLTVLPRVKKDHIITFKKEEG